ncbi:hypothetical protein SCHPADRAFT_995121 [Schizopora paradoxa]|uniref:Uncharacterized protein n=1 Tax=Schizopora paradoxa TaxID=27342 RepID=A0A0H2SHA7_9AGAM|nr:hypothetical protein SCHPADRAFT_995121 [Schizopora paradoxa]
MIMIIESTLSDRRPLLPLISLSSFLSLSSVLHSLAPRHRHLISNSTDVDTLLTGLEAGSSESSPASSSPSSSRDIEIDTTSSCVSTRHRLPVSSRLMSSQVVSGRAGRNFKPERLNESTVLELGRACPTFEDCDSRFILALALVLVLALEWMGSLVMMAGGGFVDGRSVTAVESGERARKTPSHERIDVGTLGSVQGRAEVQAEAEEYADDRGRGRDVEFWRLREADWFVGWSFVSGSGWFVRSVEAALGLG